MTSLPVASPCWNAIEVVGGGGDTCCPEPELAGRGMTWGGSTGDVGDSDDDVGDSVDDGTATGTSNWRRGAEDVGGWRLLRASSGMTPECCVSM